MSERYRLLDHTADIRIQAFGRNECEIFENAAYALFDIITDVSIVEPRGEVKISTESSSIETLLVDFLNELIFAHSTMRYLFSEFHVEIKGLRLDATARGEEMDISRHVLKDEVKAVTYHMIEFNRMEKYAIFIVDV